ncbi:hypothetical protein D3C81_744520 [compost metagenome]
MRSEDTLLPTLSSSSPKLMKDSIENLKTLLRAGFWKEELVQLFGKPPMVINTAKQKMAGSTQ